MSVNVYSAVGSTFISARQILQSVFWPSEQLPLPNTPVLDDCGIIEVGPGGGAAGIYSVVFGVRGELALYLEQLGIELVFFAGNDGFLSVPIQLDVSAAPKVEFTAQLAVRFHPRVLRPARGTGAAAVEADHTTWSKVLFGARISIDVAGHFALGPAGPVSLSKSEIGDSGIAIEAEGLQLDLAASSPRVTLQKAKLFLPDDVQGLPDIELKEVTIDGTGFSGAVYAEWDLPVLLDRSDFAPGARVGTLFTDDLRFAFKEVGVRFQRNTPVELTVRGGLKIPAFNSVVEAELGIGQGGRVLVGLVGLGGASLIRLSKEDLFALDITAFTVERTPEEVSLTMSGGISFTHPSIRDILPKVTVQGLRILRRAGQWDYEIKGAGAEINKSIDLFGVARADIKEIGFSKEGSDPSVLFSGGVHIMEGVDGGGWVKNLRVVLRSPPDIKLDGIGLELVVPDSFAVIGSIERHEEPGRNFLRGDVALYLFPVELEIGAAMMVGKNPHCRFAFQSAFVIWPGPGFPIGCLPLYLRGLKGVVGANVTPDANGIRDYYPLAAKDPQGLESPEKWRDECGSHAIGLGAFIATASPKLLSMEALFLFLYPQLRLLLEGRAFVLEAPSPGKKPPFQMLCVLDLLEPAALLNIGARAEFLKGLYEVEGMLEAYYGPDERNPNKTTSYFALGQVKPYFPVDRPVRGKILKLFPADAYFIVKGGIWAFGGGIGLKKKFGFNFAKVHLTAEMRTRGEIDWSPVQFTGGGRLRGAVGFRVYGKGFDLSLGADVVAKAPDFYVDGSLKFGIKIKLIVKKVEIGATLPFHWERRVTPPVSKLLNEIALKHAITQVASVPHLVEGADSSLSAAAPDLTIVPDVEPDTYIALEFAFPTKDTTGLPFGQNVVTVPRRKSGDYTFEALLEGDDAPGVEMYRRKLCDDGVCDEDWQPFGTDAQNVGRGTQESDEPILFGAWQASEAPSGLGFATHLHLFGRTPFEFTRPSKQHYRTSARTFATNQTGVGTATIHAVGATPVGSDAATAAVAATTTSTGVGGDEGLNLVVAIPVTEDVVRTRDERRSEGKPLPSYAAQYVTNEDPHYPYTGGSVTPDGKVIPRESERVRICRNFIRTSPGYRRPMEVVVLDGGRGMPGADGEVLLGGYGIATTRGRNVRLGNCEVGQLSRIQPMRWFEWHCNRGLDRDGRLLVNQQLRGGVLKILLRDRVSKLTLHFGRPTHARPPTRGNCGGKNPLFGILVNCAGDPIAKATIVLEGTKQIVTTAADGTFCFAGNFRQGEKLSLHVTVGKSGSWKQVVEAAGEPVWVVRDASTSSDATPLVLVAAAQKKYSRREFWRDGKSVRRPTIHWRKTSVEFSALPGNDFNQLTFRISASLRIFSLCYEVDPTHELNDKDDQLDEFISVTWPRRPAGESGGEGTGGSGTGTGGGTEDGAGDTTGTTVWGPGPGFVNGPQFYTPEGGIIPGYLYKVIVRTSHERFGRKAKAPTYKNYTAYFKVSHPPSKLAPYVLDVFPKEEGFPNFRLAPIYIRTTCNYVHKLFRGFEDSVQCQFRHDGRDIGGQLAFRDGNDADLSAFETNTSSERRGWGWGKTGDGHALTREETVWLDAYNTSVPDAQQVTEDQAVPDDVLWIWPINAVLIRAEFNEPASTDDGSVRPFTAAILDSGETAPGRWSTDASQLLRHVETSQSNINVDADDRSYLLNAGSPLTDQLEISIWIRPDRGWGLVGLVAATASNDDEVLGQFLSVELDIARKRVAIWQKMPGEEPSAKAEATFALPTGRWSRLQVRVTTLNGKVSVTVHQSKEVLLTTQTDIASTEGRVGLVASRDFVGALDNFEVLSVERLAQLPVSAAPHDVVMRHDGSVIYEHTFKSSYFLDMFDLLNSWDRAVWRSSSPASNPDAALTGWRASETAFKVKLGQLWAMESRLRIGNATVDDVEAERRSVRDARFALDQAFAAVASALGFELSPRPQGMQFVVSGDGRGLLLELAEPIDWTRYGTGPIVEAMPGGRSVQPALVYSSDFTRTILILGTVSSAPTLFQPLSTYLWSIRQSRLIPEHLAWLRGWLEHHARDFVVTLEIPSR
jgi:hypothetical protein